MRYYIVYVCVCTAHIVYGRMRGNSKDLNLERKWALPLISSQSNYIEEIFRFPW